VILLLDVGNSRMKWASLEHGKLHYGGSIAYQNLAFDDLARSLWGDLAQPSRVVASNVAGRAFAESLAAWVQGFWALRTEFIVPQHTGHGVVNAYIEPRQLGSDRWAALIAARRKSAGAAAIVDCGTAIVIDALSAEGKHLGGLIVPGLAMMRRALTEGALGIAHALEVRVESRAALLARDTHGGVAGGTLYAAVALIDRVVCDMAAELRTDLTCLLTGGDAPCIMPLLTGPCRYEQHLVIEGLAIIAEQKL
jgi:type III pantothenate kinase